jgi:hypothetical protein
MDVFRVAVIETNVPSRTEEAQRQQRETIYL